MKIKFKQTKFENDKKKIIINNKNSAETLKFSF